MYSMNNVSVWCPAHGSKNGNILALLAGPFAADPGLLWMAHCLEQRILLNIQGMHKRMVRFQKLTRNLFLTLHGHNVHRQQRQLPKFLMH